MKILRIPPEQVAQRWSTIVPFLEDALTKAVADVNADQTKVYLSSGQWLLLGGFEGENLLGIVAVQFSNRANDRVAFITAVGGREIINETLIDEFRTILRAQGATMIQGCVRESVARLLRKFGFAERAILVENKL